MRSVRLFYKKIGNLKFISHLDINRFMIKMIRLSGVPVWYSEGFNPHPYITFALPLSLGFESNYEVMDVRLDDDNFKNEDVLNCLKSKMPKGIEFFAVANPVMKAGSIAFADYEIVFDTVDNKVLEVFENFLSKDSIIAQKLTKKGKMKDIDLKEFVSSFNVANDKVLLRLSAGGSANLNPKLLLDTFEKECGINLPPYSVTRTMLYNEKMERFA